MLLENYMSTKVFTLPVSKLQQQHYSICQQHLIEMENKDLCFRGVLNVEDMASET